MTTVETLQAENEALRALLRRARRFFSWGAYTNENGEEVGDVTPGESCRVVDRSMCEAIDSVMTR
jgi:hypothetical protein